MKNKIKIISSMFIFGSIGIFVKNINLPSIEIAFLRALIGSLFLLCAGFMMKHKLSIKLIKENILILTLSGVALGLNWILLFQAYKYTTVSNSTLSYYFAPIFVIMLAPVILKEKLTLIKILCVIVAMSGLFLIVSVGGDNITDSSNHLLGITYGLCAAVLYASIILMNKFIKDLSGFESTLIQLAIATLVLLPIIIYRGNIHVSKISSVAWIFILIVGVLHTGISYLMYFSSIQELKGQSIAILSYIDPISAVILASIFLGETITLIKIIGGVLILGSTFLSEILETKSMHSPVEL
ncbi:DMT family transporter [Clostridium lacusfryxellense]|uniref:DMT family transporter n=1 Tax=Clostridium lacusfryxellense TaxID=205328 RepID=UPI001C0E3E9C|nr:DMT family transporter [Clostridium lacusfryxellense]MBU3110256.1 DMT family transporter [Clostridium lacusfryxellense]